MRVAVAQQQLEPTFELNMAKVSAMTKEAADRGAEVVCFGEFFLGEDIDCSGLNSVYRFILDLGSRNSICVVSGSFPLELSDAHCDVSLMVDAEGHALGYQSKFNPNPWCLAEIRCGDELGVFETPLGQTSILSGLDAIDPEVDEHLVREHPEALIMQLSPITELEREAVRELALKRSFGDANVVVVPALCGGGDRCLMGSSFVALEGEMIAEAGRGEELLTVDLDPLSYVRIESIREGAVIPELLLQKLAAEKAAGGAGA